MTMPSKPSESVVREWAVHPKYEYALAPLSEMTVSQFVTEHNAAIRHLRAEVEALRAQVQRRDLLLQSLTPMGSEYVNDPERCAAYAHETRRAHFERWKKVALDLKAAERRNAALVTLLEKVHPALFVLRNLCRAAKLNEGEKKALEMIGWVDAAIKRNAAPLLDAASEKETG
jgi:hypothetical protein